MTQQTKADREREQRFRDTVLPHLAAIHRYALRLTRNEADAQDAVQDCCLSALRHFASFRGGSVQAWLRTILRNVCNTAFARRARREQLVERPEAQDDAEQALWLGQQATPEAILEGRQDIAAVRLIVDALPPPLRQAIVLREFEDLSYREIAHVSRAPIGTVMSRLARARARFREGWLSTQADTLGGIDDGAVACPAQCWQRLVPRAEAQGPS